MSHTEDRSQSAPQPTSAGRGSRETAGPSSTVTEQRTPGPWFPVWNGNYWDINIADELYAHSVGVVWARVPGLQVGAEADARLIAAAPDLLVAANEQLALINHAQAILSAYLVPDGMSAGEAISQLLALLDGPEQRRVAALYGAALAKAEGRS